MQVWSEKPDMAWDVVVVLRPGTTKFPAEWLGPDSIEPIPYQTGMFKATLTGAELVALAGLPEIEDIALDEEVQAL